MLLTGKQVKELAAARGWLLVKFLPFGNLEGEGREGYKYKYGLNIPKETVNLSSVETCCGGGLYFTYVRKGKFNVWHDTYAYTVSVPDDARVYFYKEEVKFKTNVLYIERGWNTEEYEEYLYMFLGWLQHISQTPELCLAEVQKNSNALQYIKEQTPEICLTAVKLRGYALEYVINQTPEICLAAVQRNGCALYYVKEQTPEICLAAVQQDTNALKFVKQRMPECTYAVVQLPDMYLSKIKFGEEPRPPTPRFCLIL